MSLTLKIKYALFLLSAKREYIDYGHKGTLPNTLQKLIQSKYTMERVVGQIKIMEGMKFKTAEIGFKTRIIFWCHGILSNSAICELQVLISGMNCSILSILNTQLLRFFFNRQILTING